MVEHLTTDPKIEGSNPAAGQHLVEMAGEKLLKLSKQVSLFYGSEENIKQIS